MRIVLNRPKYVILDRFGVLCRFCKACSSGKAICSKYVISCHFESLLFPTLRRTHSATNLKDVNRTFIMRACLYNWPNKTKMRSGSFTPCDRHHRLLYFQRTFLKALGQKVKGFATLKELREYYTHETGKFFPKEKAED
jgi:hypothetical protein